MAVCQSITVIRIDRVVRPSLGCLLPSFVMVALWYWKQLVSSVDSNKERCAYNALRDREAVFQRYFVGV
jgi:hypothetical protein